MTREAVNREAMTRPHATAAAAIVAGAMSALIPMVVPSAAWAAPSTGPGAGGNVVNAPDIAAGARNAPGGQAIADLVNAIGFYTIMACMVGFLLSGLILAIGPRLGFGQASTIGKVGIIATLGVAFLVGIAATLINFSYNAGR